MTSYELYLESGPKRRKTMVHVLDLLGCTASGPTTEAALDATPDAIRAYLRFLRRHGEPVDPESHFDTPVAKHVTEGVWLGNGDPTGGFPVDFLPLSHAELATYVRLLAWLQADLREAIQIVPAEARQVASEGKGRSIRQIVDHLAGSHCTYLRYQVGKVGGLAQSLKAVEAGAGDQLGALDQLWRIANQRLLALTDVEREQVVQHGMVTWTSRRMLRRMLEHGWEHLSEISGRLTRDSYAFE